MYEIEFRIASKNGWFTPQEARNYYGRYDRSGITVHWWNSPDRIKDSDHDNIVNYILGKARAGTGSVNYVLSNKKITLVVGPDNVAWASQKGNPTTVSVEFSPHLNDEGYKKAGWLINELEGRYGRVLKIHKHSEWFQTQCPGTLDLNRMRKEADNWKRGQYDPNPPAPKPKPAPETNVDDWEVWTDPQVYITNKQPTRVYDFDQPGWDMPIERVYNKGVKINIGGQAKNTAIGRVYYTTAPNATVKNAHGFHPADLDLFVPPEKPAPTPPNPEPIEVTDPEPEAEPEVSPQGGEENPPTQPTEPTPEPPKSPDVPVVVPTENQYKIRDIITSMIKSFFKKISSKLPKIRRRKG